MRSLRRPNVLPPTLAPTGDGGVEKARREELWQRSHRINAVNRDFPTHWGNADVRGALYAMHGRACAYCQRNLPGSDRGDVEHFRPKNVYWWLAYEYENFLLSCTVCNSALKINKFPILPRSRPYDYSRRNRIRQERRALVDPAEDSVEGSTTIDFDEDRVRREGYQVLVRDGVQRTLRQRCEETIAFFRLNTESELLRERFMYVHLAMNFLRLAEGGDTQSADELRKMASRYQPHAFVIRELLTSHSGRPQYLPNERQEVEWLVDEFLGLLESATNALNANPNNRRERALRNRCAWALAVLMTDPPVLSAAQIRARIDAAGHLAIVEQFFDQI
jgi:uncharacterized protein (TIGR02646 family)